MTRETAKFPVWNIGPRWFRVLMTWWLFARPKYTLRQLWKGTPTREDAHMDIGAKLREIVKDIEAHLPGHPDAKVLSSMATEWSGRDLAAEDRAAYTEVPVGESVDLDAAQAQVTADTAADGELLAASTEATPAIPPDTLPVAEPAPAASP